MTVMDIVHATETTYAVTLMAAALVVTPAAAAVLGCDTLDVFADTELTDDQADRLTAIVAARIAR